MNIGWISLHRKLLNNPIVCKDSDYMAVWIYLLLNATHAEYDTIFKGSRITLRAGQLITGRDVISKKFKINSSKTQRILKKLENEHQIEQQTSNVNRLITITNWSEYQDGEQRNEQPVNNQRTTSEQPVNTNNNINNTNKGNKVIAPALKKPTKTKPKIVNNYKKWTVEEFTEEIKKHGEEYTSDMKNDFYRYWSEPNEKGKMLFQLKSSWCTSRRLTTWKRRSEK